MGFKEGLAALVISSATVTGCVNLGDRNGMQLTPQGLHIIRETNKQKQTLYSGRPWKYGESYHFKVEDKDGNGLNGNARDVRCQYSGKDREYYIEFFEKKKLTRIYRIKCISPEYLPGNVKSQTFYPDGRVEFGNRFPKELGKRGVVFVVPGPKL